MLAQTFTHNGEYNIRTTCIDDVPYMCGRDVAIALGYKNHAKAIRDHVYPEDRMTLDALGQRGANNSDTLTKYNVRHLTWITEAGVYALIFGSHKEEARHFKQFVCQQIIPFYRRVVHDNSQAPLCLKTESDLHERVVSFIRRFYSHCLLAASLGELQDSSDKRIASWRRGYRSGSPDITIMNANAKHNGFAIEFKAPSQKGKLSDKQHDTLIHYERAGYKTLVTSDYDQTIKEVIEYMQNVRLVCPHCPKKFKSEATLDRHLGRFHRLCC